MEFTNYNFKLIVINELIGLGLLEKEMAPVYKKQDEGYYEKYYEEKDKSMDDEFYEEFGDDMDDDFDLMDDGEDRYYSIHPEMAEEIGGIELSADLLAQIEKIDIDYGEVQGMLAPNWHGEDEQFKVTDLSDVRLLPNLKEVKLSFALDPEIKSLAPLLKLPQLKEVYTVMTLKPEYFFAKDRATLDALKKKGIKVYRETELTRRKKGLED